ncbi:MAG TPA: SIMPL domain-containing protein [Candidatus Angelobacter sp.]
MKSLMKAACLLFAATFAAAQNQTPQIPAKLVRVVGTAEIKVTPDLALIELGVRKQDASADLAMRAASLSASKLLETLHANGIADNDIQTTFLALTPTMETRKGIKTTYFVAEQTISIVIRDLSKVEPLIQWLLKSGGNRIGSIDYDTSEIRKYRDQAREMAVKAAREKAKALAAALGQDIGKAISIEEAPGNVYRSNASAEVQLPHKLAGGSIAAGQTTVSASVTVAFELI